MEHRQNTFLQDLPHVDQYVATDNKIEARKWRVACQIVARKNTGFAYRFDNLISAVYFYEVTPDSLRCYISCDCLWVNCFARALQRLLTDIGAEELQLRSPSGVCQQFIETNGS